MQLLIVVILLSSAAVGSTLHVAALPAVARAQMTAYQLKMSVTSAPPMMSPLEQCILHADGEEEVLACIAAADEGLYVPAPNEQQISALEECLAYADGEVE